MDVCAWLHPGWQKTGGLLARQWSSSAAHQFSSATGVLLLYQTFPAASTLPANHTTTTAPLRFWHTAVTEFLPTTSPRAALVCKTTSQVVSAAGHLVRSLG